MSSDSMLVFKEASATEMAQAFRKEGPGGQGIHSRCGR